MSSEFVEAEEDVHSKSTPLEHSARTPAFPLILAVLAVALLAIAAGSLSQSHALSEYLGHVVSSICPTPTALESDIALSPALKAAIQEYVLETMQALEGQNSAGHQVRDFARKGSGGRIALQLTSGHRGFFRNCDDDPSIAIDDVVDTRRCWTMPPLPSQLGIRLAHLILPSYISIEHLSGESTAERAPQNMTLWGVIDGKANTELYKTLETTVIPRTVLERRAPSLAKDLLWAPLASFVYDIHGGRSRQTFVVAPQYADAGITFGVFALEVYSNWGHASTCLYKIGIHGVLP